MKTCPKCYKEIPPDSEFCPYCGEAIKEEVTLRNENNIIDSSHTVAAQKTVEKKKRPTGIIIICAVFVLALILAGAYWGTYSAAKRAASNKDFSKAKELLFVPSLTEMHDPDIFYFIQAGELYSKGNYGLARTKFGVLAENDYLNSKELERDAAYHEAKELMKKGSYWEAEYIFNSLAEEEYLDSELLKNEASYQGSLEQLNIGNLSGYRTIASLARRGYLPAVNGLEAAKKQVYDYAVSKYHEGDYFSEIKARSYFCEIKDYKRSEDYLTLIDNPSLSALTKLIGFENANEKILDQYPCQFLEGTWKTSDGRYNFSMQEANDGSYHTNYNLPYLSLAHSYFNIEDGIYFLFDQNVSVNDQMLGEYEKKNVFRFTIIVEDTIKVYCYKDGSTYKLFRQ